MTDGGSARARAQQLWAQAAAEREREDAARARAEELETQAGAWAAGAEGERRVAQALDKLPSGWVVLHDRLLRPGQGQANLDHVVIGPGGVFLVDAKNWAGGVSVHDGNLWQHAGRSTAKGAELDKLARFAGEMEKALATPVVPVIALAGGHGARLRAQRVRGVEVVPCSRLAGWLRGQASTTDAGTVEHLSRKVAHTYPPASSDATAAATSAAGAQTVPAIVGASRPTPRRHVRARSTTAVGRRRRRSFGKALVAMVAFFLISQLGPQLPALSERLPHWPPLARGSAPSPADATTADKACPALTKAMIAKATGAKVVVEQARPGDACGWWLAKPRYANQSADVTVETGTPVRIQLAATGSTESRIDMLPGQVTAWLPENTSLAGWPPGTRTSEALRVSLRFSYPAAATSKQARNTEASAEQKVARLAEQLAVGLGRPPTSSRLA